jgi:hypothetical protein
MELQIIKILAGRVILAFVWLHEDGWLLWLQLIRGYRVCCQTPMLDKPRFPGVVWRTEDCPTDVAKTRNI